MSDSSPLDAALESRYPVERELGHGVMSRSRDCLATRPEVGLLDRHLGAVR